jgi:hypothetical protein
MDDQEIRFWRAKVNEGSLIKELRAAPGRAILFFGKAAVLSENEGELCRTIDAYEIINSSDSELLAKMNSVPDSLAESLHRVSPSELRRHIEQISRFSAKDILAMKKDAREHLRRATS